MTHLFFAVSLQNDDLVRFGNEPPLYSVCLGHGLLYHFLRCSVSQKFLDRFHVFGGRHGEGVQLKGGDRYTAADTAKGDVKGLGVQDGRDDIEKSSGSAAEGLIMLRWFSTTTPSCVLMKSSGRNPAIKRLFCSLAVVRWTSTQGSLVTKYCCPGFTWKYGLWFRRTALKLKLPSAVTDSAQIRG
jgi:hypothetical protein